MLELDDSFSDDTRNQMHWIGVNGNRYKIATLARHDHIMPNESAVETDGRMRPLPRVQRYMDVVETVVSFDFANKIHCRRFQFTCDWLLGPELLRGRRD